MYKVLIKRFFFLFSLVAIFGLLLSSCLDEREPYFHYRELKDAAWPKEEVLSFAIDSTDISLGVSYRISIELTNNSNYLYQNLWLVLDDDIASNGSLSYYIAREYQLATKDGKWIGDGFGSLYQRSLLYKKRVVFTEKRNYTVHIRHSMYDQPLNGIERVGLRIAEVRN